MRRAAAFLLSLLLAGCSDPESSRFRPGDEAIAYSGKTDAVPLETADRGLVTPSIAVGTHVTIVSDAYRDPVSYRRVKVRVREGPQADRVGLVTRFDLRPAR